MTPAALSPSSTDLVHVSQWLAWWLLAALVLAVWVGAILRFLDRIEDRRIRQFLADRDRQRAVLANVTPVDPERERQVLDAFARVDGRHARLTAPRVH